MLGCDCHFLQADFAVKGLWAESLQEFPVTLLLCPKETATEAPGVDSHLPRIVTLPSRS